MAKDPFWKILFSYLYPVVLEQRQGVGQLLEVRLENGKRVLNSANANYSFGSLHRVWQKGLKKEGLEKSDRILVLGGGAGSIRVIIREELGIDLEMTFVEKDPTVLALGAEYFEHRTGSRIQILEQDAFEFIENTKERYDLILIDLFNDLEIPRELYDARTWRSIRSILNEGGRILLNTILSHRDQVAELKGAIEKNSFEVQLMKIDINTLFRVS